MKKEYLIIDYNGEPVFKRDTKKEIKSDLKDHIKNTGFTFRDYRIFKIEYNSKKIKSDLFLYDFLLIDKITNEVIEYDNFEKYGIKENEIKKDFLYHNL